MDDVSDLAQETTILWYQAKFSLVHTKLFTRVSFFPSSEYTYYGTQDIFKTALDTRSNTINSNPTFCRSKYEAIARHLSVTTRQVQSWNFPFLNLPSTALTALINQDKIH